MTCINEVAFNIRRWLQRYDIPPSSVKITFEFETGRSLYYAERGVQHDYILPFDPAMSTSERIQKTSGLDINFTTRRRGSCHEC